MRHALPLAPQFYVTAPQPCPYLDGQVERKLFTALQGEHACILNDTLSRQGFRRSQNILYRPSCEDCNACLSARICVTDFTLSKSHRRILRKNSHLIRHSTSPWATEEQYELFRAYLNTRHAEGGMAEMDIFEFGAMIEETNVQSRVVEYYTPKDQNQDCDKLTSVCLTDVLEDGLSLVYSFFDPKLHAWSLGTNMILDHIKIAREAGLPYLYLGYWVPGSSKMQYKANFSALEVFLGGKWQSMNKPSEFKLDSLPLSPDSIPEQVAGINLPDALNG
jgi:arginine-tRNA-protein transferase